MPLFASKKRNEIPQYPVNYPYGLFVVTETGYYMIRDNGRLHVGSFRMASSWNTKFILSSETALADCPVIGQVGFRDGTMIKNQADKKEYLISRGMKRQIVSPDVFDRYGLDRKDTILVSDEEAQFHKDGEVLS